MDADRFDALTRSFQLVSPRRTALGVLGAGLAGLLATSTQESAAKPKKGKDCPRGKKKCQRKCIPKNDCCKNAECGVNEKCANGACVTCKPQGTACIDDAECCTDICDKYTNKCQQVRVSCAAGEPCPNGRCCPQYHHCLYEKATQRACEPTVSCGYVLCGDKCGDFDDGTYEYCGYEGSAACRNGRCCCPQGIPLTDCPSYNAGEEFLPRCP
jgi:hypothetical protein